VRICTEFSKSAIQLIYIDNNPFWPAENEEELRVKFLGKIVQMDNVGASLKHLNGYEIRIIERVKYKPLSEYSLKYFYSAVHCTKTRFTIKKAWKSSEFLSSGKN